MAAGIKMWAAIGEVSFLLLLHVLFYQHRICLSRRWKSKACGKCKLFKMKLDPGKSFTPWWHYSILISCPLTALYQSYLPMTALWIQASAVTCLSLSVTWPFWCQTVWSLSLHLKNSNFSQGSPYSICMETSFSAEGFWAQNAGTYTRKHTHAHVTHHTMWTWKQPQSNLQPTAEPSTQIYRGTLQYLI